MKNRLLKAVKITCIPFIITLVVFFNKTNDDSKSDHSVCNLNSSSCVISTEKPYFKVQFLSEIVTEEEIRLAIELDDAYEINSAWVEGVDMYMGKTPILFEHDKENGVTFLGSCNLSEMKWMLNFEVRNKKSGEQSMLSAAFSTFRN